jgi:hypothetical protein
MRPESYFLGVGEPSWLNHGDGVPKFVIAPRLARYRTGGDRWPVGSQSRYALDCGAFMALNGSNTNVPFFLDDDEYGGMVARFVDNNGYPPDFCAPRDVPCEPGVRKKTGMTVDEHQDLSTDSFVWLEREFPWLPWIPVLQGWEPEEYKRHRRKYEERGIDLASYHRVGLGSVCRRAHLPQIVEVIGQFAEDGIKLHGFGVKITALPKVGHLLTSADSMAWSLHARKNNIYLPGCTHAGPDCRNCYRYAVAWRERVLTTLTGPTAPALDERADTGIERETITMSTATIKPGMKVRYSALPVGAYIECPGSGCGRQAKIRHKHLLGKHYCYGKQTCKLAGEHLGDRDVHYRREPDASVGRRQVEAKPEPRWKQEDFDPDAGQRITYKDFTGKLVTMQVVSADWLGVKGPSGITVPYGTIEELHEDCALCGNSGRCSSCNGESAGPLYRCANCHGSNRCFMGCPVAEPEPVADDSEAAALFAGLVAAAPTVEPERESWTGIGPEPLDGVAVAEVALGTFGKVYGKGPDGAERTEQGYVVQVQEVGADCWGWGMPTPGYEVLVADHPDCLDGRAAWTELDAQMTVCEPGEREPRGTAAPYTATAAGKLASDAAWNVLSRVTTYHHRYPDNNDPNAEPTGAYGMVTGVDRQFRDAADVASYLFGGEQFWSHRIEAIPAQRHIDEAIAKGTFKGVRLAGPMIPLRKVNDGAWIRVRGERYTDVECREVIPGQQLVEGELMGWWTHNTADDRSGMVIVRMRVDDPKTMDGKRVIGVGIPGDAPAIVDVIDRHAKPEPEAAAEPQPHDTRPALPVGSVVPLHEVPWGTFGELSGYYPDGSVAKKVRGYLMQLPRVFTGSIMDKPKLCGPDNPLLSLDLYEIKRYPGEKKTTGCMVGFKAGLDATFTVLEPPAEHPLPAGDSPYGRTVERYRTSRSDRMPSRDLRKGDLVDHGYLGTVIHSGKRSRVLDDPKALADGRVELTVEQDGVVNTHVMKGDDWVTVADAVPYRPDGEVVARQEPAEVTAIRARAVNDDATLDGLLARITADTASRMSVKNATAAAERYALGLPVLKRAKSNTAAWSFVCPEPTCLTLRDGWTTLRGLRVAWMEHAAEHSGFIGGWDDEQYPVQEGPQFEMPEAPVGKTAKASVEVAAPKDDAWFYWTINRLQADGRVQVRDLGARGLRVTFGFSAAAKVFAQVLLDGGLPPAHVIVNLPEREPKPLSAAKRAGLSALLAKAGIEAGIEAAARPEQLVFDFLAAYEAENASAVK